MCYGPSARRASNKVESIADAAALASTPPSVPLAYASTDSSKPWNNGASAYSTPLVTPLPFVVPSLVGFDPTLVTSKLPLDPSADFVDYGNDASLMMPDPLASVVQQQQQSSASIEDWIASIGNMPIDLSSGSEMKLEQPLPLGLAIPLTVAAQEVPAPLVISPTLDEEEMLEKSISKAEMKRMKNTEAARQSRRRKNELLSCLEEKVVELETRNKEVERDNAILKTENAGYFRRIEALERQVNELHHVLMAFGANIVKRSQSVLEQEQQQKEHSSNKRAKTKVAA